MSYHTTVFSKGEYKLTNQYLLLHKSFTQPLLNSHDSVVLRYYNSYICLVKDSNFNFEETLTDCMVFSYGGLTPSWGRSKNFNLLPLAFSTAEILYQISHNLRLQVSFPIIVNPEPGYFYTYIIKQCVLFFVNWQLSYSHLPNWSSLLDSVCLVPCQSSWVAWLVETCEALECCICAARLELAIGIVRNIKLKTRKIFQDQGYKRN